MFKTLTNRINDLTEPKEKYYFAIGDSITQGNHTGIEQISPSDKYYPQGGTSGVSDYKRKKLSIPYR